jgi:hypothetical protein
VDENDAGVEAKCPIRHDEQRVDLDLGDLGVRGEET